MTAESFETIVVQRGEPCLVLFSRDNCPLCDTVHPILEELSTEEGLAGSFGFYEVDVTTDRELFKRLNLKGVPQVLFFKDGKNVGRKMGAKSMGEYLSMIRSMMR